MRALKPSSPFLSAVDCPELWRGLVRKTEKHDFAQSGRKRDAATSSSAGVMARPGVESPGLKRFLHQLIFLSLGRQFVKKNPLCSTVPQYQRDLGPSRLEEPRFASMISEQVTCVDTRYQRVVLVR